MVDKESSAETFVLTVGRGETTDPIDARRRHRLETEASRTTSDCWPAEDICSNRERMLAMLLFPDEVRFMVDGGSVVVGCDHWLPVWILRTKAVINAANDVSL